MDTTPDCNLPIKEVSQCNYSWELCLLFSDYSPKLEDTYYSQIISGIICQSLVLMHMHQNLALTGLSSIISFVIIVIIVSTQSPRFAGLIGRRDPVAALATLILLSYAKLLSVTITVLSFAVLDFISRRFTRDCGFLMVMLSFFKENTLHLSLWPCSLF